MRWAQEQRMKYITELLETRGFMNRVDLKEKFNISIVQASVDIQTYMRLYPNNMAYVMKSKRYERKTNTGGDGKAGNQTPVEASSQETTGKTSGGA